MVTRTLICLDEVRQQELCGRIYNPYMADATPFQSIQQLLYLMEQFFDEVDFPQPSFSARLFAGPPDREEQIPPQREVTRYHPDDVLSKNQGRLASLELTVQFRHRAEWQGTLLWLEGQQLRGFDSTLELIRMLEQVLERVTGQPLIGDNWN